MLQIPYAVSQEEGRSLTMGSMKLDRDVVNGGSWRPFAFREALRPREALTRCDALFFPGHMARARAPRAVPRLIPG